MGGRVPRFARMWPRGKGVPLQPSDPLEALRVQMWEQLRVTLNAMNEELAGTRRDLKNSGRNCELFEKNWMGFGASQARRAVPSGHLNKPGDLTIELRPLQRINS